MSSGHLHPLLQIVHNQYAKFYIGGRGGQIFKVYLQGSSARHVCANDVLSLLAVHESLDVEPKSRADSHDILSIQLLQDSRLPSVI